MTRTKPRSISAVFATLFLILASLIALPAHANPVGDEAELQQLINDAGATPAVIDLDGPVELTSTLVIPAGSNLTLRPATEEGASLLGRPSVGNVMVRVEEGASLTLDPTGPGVLTLSADGYRVRVLDVMGTAVLNDGLITGMSGDPGGTGLPGRDSARGAVTVTGAGNLTMNGGAIAGNDMGNNAGGVQGTGANISVFHGGTFTMNGGEIRDGRTAKEHWAFHATGGLGLYGSATFTMNGGRITGNDGGSIGGIAINAGDIYWDGSINGADQERDKARWLDPNLGITATINGGEISNNKGYFYGGGIGGFGKFDLTMTGGTIANNWAQFHGGGVHVQDYYVTGNYDEGAGGWKPGPGKSLGYSLDEWKAIVPASFTMTGGTIANNYAGSSGGGVNIVSDSVTLSGGLITENSVPRRGGMGGGIYVGSQPYTLHMKNVHFADNAAVQGGALWNCPTGHTTLHAEDGAAFTGNTASRFGNDLQVYPIGKGSGQATPEMDMRLATRMLGGEHLDWYVDGYRNRQFAPFVDRYVPGSGKGTLVDPTELKDNPAFIGLATEPAAGGSAIPTCNTLIVSNNDGDMGGGLGTNGNVIIGTEAETVSLKVLKKWAAGATPPEQLEVNLYAGENKIDSAILTEESEWTAVFADLPRNICGEAVSYSIREVATEGWTTVISDPVSANKLTAEVGDEPDITITNSPLVSLKVLKTWDGDNPPEQLQVTLLADGSPVDEATLSAENDWQHIFTGLPAAKNGEAINYTIAEAEIAGWTSTVSEPVAGTDLSVNVGPEDPANITLTNTKLTELKVEKVWQSGSHELPASIDVILLANGEEVGTATLTAENDWQHVFSGLPVAKDGEVITYSIAEADLPGWAGVVTDAVPGDELRDTVGAEDPADITLTNTKLVSLKVEKVWQAGQVAIPDSLEVTLLADGEEVSSAILSAENGWSHVFADLPAAADGKEITYSIAEADLDGWVSALGASVPAGELPETVGEDDPATITLTNTALTELKVVKEWLASGHALPESLDVTLLADGEEVSSATLTAANGWSHVFTGLPVMKDGEEITYQVVEADLGGWSGIVSGPVSGGDLRPSVGADDPADITLTNTKLVSLKVAKAWENAGHGLPESLEATLLANGEPVETVMLTAENDWQHIFTDLPVVVGGEEITYSIAEAELDGWAGSVSDPVAAADLRPSVGTDDPADITLTNTKLVELKVEKKWLAAGHDLPESITVFLAAGDYAVEKVELNADNGWSHVFTDLPAQINGEEVIYSILEEGLDGWSVAVTDPVGGGDLRPSVGADDPADITLTNTKLVSLKVAKEWRAGGHHLPDSLEATLLANGEPVETVMLTAENDWQHIFTDLPVVVGGEEITYSIAEAELDGWAGSVSDPVAAADLRPSIGADDSADITLINTKLINITGTKVWVGGDEPRPDIELQLMRGIEGEEPEAVGEPQVLVDGVTEVTWEGLPATDAEGRPYAYSVDEVSVPEGYEMVRVDDVTVENRLLPPPSDPPTDPPPTIPPTEPPADPPLVTTGASVVHLAALGALLIAAGTVAVIRRRRAE